MNLNQVTVPSSDLATSVEFYKKLGLNLIVDALPRYARFECPDGTATFSVHLVDQLYRGSGIVVYFECEDLDNYCSILINKGISFDELPEDKSWLWKEAKLKDPDGNHIILYYAGKHRKHPPWRVIC